MTPRPLAERVERPTVRLPAGEGGLTWRPATTDDVDAVVALYGAMAAVDHPEWAASREEVAAEFTRSWVDLERDTMLAEFDGIPVGFGQVIEPPDPETIVREVLFGGVHPAYRGRGIGRQLLAWQVDRARERLSELDSTLPAWVLAYPEGENRPHRRLLERAGFRLARHFIKMVRDLADPIPELPLPDGLHLAVPTREDAARILDARNAAFRDHWGGQPTSDEQWASFIARSTIRLDLGAIAIDDDGAVQGFVLTEVNPDDFPRQGYAGGYIPLVGVRREWRRRGVAPALLAAALAASARAGYQKVALDVDAENPTGALRLYTGLGFAETARSMAYTLEY